MTLYSGYDQIDCIDKQTDYAPTQDHMLSLSTMLSNISDYK